MQRFGGFLRIPGKTNRDTMKFFPLLLLLWLFCGAAPAALAQSTGRDIVFLKNGSEIHGTLLDPDSLGRLRIKIQGGSIFAYAPEEVLKIEKDEPVNGFQSLFPEHSPKVVVPKPPILKPEAGKIYGTAEFTPRPMMKLSIGKHITPNLDAGGGVGVSVQLLSMSETAFDYAPFFLPVFGEVRYRFSSTGAATPFVYAAGGYNQPLYRNQTLNGSVGKFAIGREYAELATGIQFFTRTNTSFLLSIGWKHQRAVREMASVWDSSPELEQITVMKSRLSLSLGMSF